MAKTVVGWIGIVSAVVLWLLVICMRLWSKQGSKVKGVLPSGSMGWPIIGETIEYYLSLASTQPSRFFDKRCLRYGMLFKTHMFLHPVIVSTDPQVNKFILSNENKLFRCSYPISVIEIFGENNLFAIHGALHKRLHGMIARNLSAEKLKVTLLRDVDTYASKIISSWGKQKIVKIEHEAQHFTFQLILKQLMGLSSMDTSLLMSEYDKVLEGIICWPSKLLPKYAKALKARDNFARKLVEVVESRRRKMDDHTISSYNDLLGAIMKEEVDEGLPLPTNQIVNLMMLILFAGYETSSRAITFAVKFLTDHPKVLRALKEEHFMILQKKTSKESLTWDDYKSMAFTQCVINETLRLINLVVGSYRQAIEDVHIKGLTIPKGWKVLVVYRVAHLDESTYSNPYKFDPWRWEGAGSSLQESFTPFGWGRRKCPGSDLARLELSLFLHHLVTRYRWEPTEEESFSYFPMPTTKHGLPLNVRTLE